MTWALIVADRVHEITGADPSDRFADDLVWLPCPPEVRVGWRHDGAAFSAPPPPVVSDAEVRLERNGRLAASDWTQMNDAPLSQAARAAWSQYRQALRDLPRQPGFPAQLVWPEAPG